MRALQDILDEMKHEIEKVCIIMPDVGAKLDELADEMDECVERLEDDGR
jgi:hypothetical protein